MQNYNSKFKIIFFGSSGHVIPIIKNLQNSFDLKLVLTTERLALQGDALRSYPVVGYCVENKIPYISVQQFNNSTIQQLEKLNATVGILADFGRIVPPEILNLFPKGIINIHPSLLPKYRGPTPVQTAILDGEKVTGVSIMKLDEEIDHGPILAQTKEPILENDTSESLYERLFKLGAGSIVQTIELYLTGEIKLQKQDDKKATFTKHLTRADGYVDMSRLPTSPRLRGASKNQISKIKLDRMIKAYFPWPGVWTKLKVQSARPPSSSLEGEVGREKLKIIKFLPRNLIQVEGKKPMSYKDFLNGYPQIKQQLRKLLGLPA